MAETELQRAERHMAEAKAKLNAAKKRDREKQRRDEQKRRQIIGTLITEHGDQILMAMVNKLIVEHANPADYRLWPQLWPEYFGEQSGNEATDAKTPANAAEQLPEDLKQTARQTDEEKRPELISQSRHRRGRWQGLRPHPPRQGTPGVGE